jgi:sterol desaturase/sphingolipid hydroxylase (fatty acid hydroxylase superfamily)
MPCTSLIAPLAPLYNDCFGWDWDRRNVEFHHSHHQILKCNYSITQWPDHLFGTTRWCPNSDGKAPSGPAAAGPSRGLASS